MSYCTPIPNLPIPGSFAAKACHRILQTWDKNLVVNFRVIAR